MKPYYDRDGITLYNADCREVIPGLPPDSVAALVSGPPYGERMGYAGDESIFAARDLLEDCLRLSAPVVADNGFVVLFWASHTFDVVFDVTRAAGFTFRRTLNMYTPQGGARPDGGWLPRTQPILVAQKYLPCQPAEFHERMAAYLSAAIQKSGKKKADLVRALGCDSRLLMKWTKAGDREWCLPTPRHYRILKSELALDDEFFDVLLRRQVGKNPQSEYGYECRHDLYRVDEPAPDLDHPTPQPLAVMRHLVTCVTRPRELVLEPFAGSGTTLVAAKMEGRRAIGVEVDATYCDEIVRRLESTPPRAAAATESRGTRTAPRTAGDLLPVAA